MDMTGVYACLFEALCDVTTVPNHLKYSKSCSFFFVVSAACEANDVMFS